MCWIKHSLSGLCPIRVALLCYAIVQSRLKGDVASELKGSVDQLYRRLEARIGYCFIPVGDGAFVQRTHLSVSNMRSAIESEQERDRSGGSVSEAALKALKDQIGIWSSFRSWLAAGTHRLLLVDADVTARIAAVQQHLDNTLSIVERCVLTVCSTTTASTHLRIDPGKPIWRGQEDPQPSPLWFPTNLTSWCRYHHVHAQLLS
jgi:hypothetical protein